MRIPFLLVLSLMVAATNAQWSTSPDSDNVVQSPPGDFDTPVFCTDGNGGVIVAYLSSIEDDDFDIRAQRVGANGTLLWAADLQVCEQPGFQWDPAIASDGNGGAFIAWADTRELDSTAYLQHLDASGTALWTPNGKSVMFWGGTNTGNTVDITTDGAGGVILVHERISSLGRADILAQRISASGALQWDSSGVMVNDTIPGRDPRVVPDGSGGVFVMWAENTADSVRVFMQRLSPEGEKLWSPVSGLTVLQDTAALGTASYDLLASGQNKAIVVLSGYGSDGVFAQKVDTAGDFLWGNTALTIRDTVGEANFAHAISDGNGGAFMTWSDGRRVLQTPAGPTTPRVQHLNAAGVELWAHQGLDVDTFPTSYGPYPSLAPDENGGIKVFWKAAGPQGDRVYMQRIDPSGQRQCLPTATAVTETGTDDFINESAFPLPGGEAILFATMLAATDLRAKFIPNGCQLDVGIAEPTVRGSLRIFPVPAEDHISVDVGEEVRIRDYHVIDATGRTVLVGTNIMHGIDISSLANGSYALRLSTDAGPMIARLMVQGR